MNKPISLSWWKSHRPATGQLKGFGGQTLPVAGSGLLHFAPFSMKFCYFNAMSLSHARVPSPVPALVMGVVGAEELSLTPPW